MEIKAIEAALEAVLFASGDPIREDRLAEALQVDKPTVGKVLGQLIARYDGPEHGVQIVRLDGSVQMVTKAEQAAVVKRALEITRDTRCPAPQWRCCPSLPTTSRLPAALSSRSAELTAPVWSAALSERA